MKKYLKRVPAALLAVLLLVTMLPMSALAAGVERPTVTIPVVVQTVCADQNPLDLDDLPENDRYTFLLKEGNAVKDTLTINGAKVDKDEKCGFGSGTFTLSFDRVGIYEYTISQGKPEGNDAGRCDYDGKTVYNVKVTITNAEDGGLKATVAMRKAGDPVDDPAYKKDEAPFVNEYAPIMKDVTVYKKWAGGNSKNRPAVVVDLLVNDNVVATGTLDQNADPEKDWTYVFVGKVRAKDNSWKIRERTIAGRYVPSYSYKYEENSATVKNTYTTDLIQTGQLNWPIPVLCMLGSALIVLGLCVIFRKREDICE